MINILDELVRVKAFQSKGEARMMIKNGGVSIIRSFHENAVPPCFKDKSVEDNIEHLTISEEDLMLETKLGISRKEDKVKIFSLANIAFYVGLFVTRCTSISSGQSMNLEIFVTENLGLTQITLVNGILVVPVALKR